MLYLIACSQQQKQYFTKLKPFLSWPNEVIWHKNLFVPSFTCRVPLTEIKKITQLYLRRKKSAHQTQQPPFYWRIIECLTFCHSVWLFYLYHRLTNNPKISTIGLWNGKKKHQAIIALSGKKNHKNLLFFETGPLPGTSCVDPLGIGYHSSIPRDTKFYQQYGQKHPFATQTLRPSCPPLPKNYIFVPFQVTEDSNIYMHSPWIRNMHDLFNEIVELHKRFPTKKFLLKTHPACPINYNDLREKTNAEYGGKITFSNLDASTLAECASCVITINSTIGIQALLSGTKVIALGESIYSINTLVQMASNRDQLFSALSLIDDWLPAPFLRSGFLSYLNNEYAVTGNAMHQPSDKHFRKMNHKIIQLLRTNQKPN